jgi:hypothetical protein
MEFILNTGSDLDTESKVDELTMGVTVSGGVGLWTTEGDGGGGEGGKFFAANNF